jgi:DDE superfamily endonuclease
MRNENRNICLTLDNFSGHYIRYEPRNIQFLYFEPNMTPFVQPLDVGIIRCFKAYYRQQFCLCAIEKDDLGERDIYKITLLEAMLMAKAAWGRVDSSTIQHCWNHTKIQGYVISDWQ